MASEVWTFMLSLALLLPAFGLAQSGGGRDDEDGEDAEPGVECFTELTIKHSRIICQFDDDFVGTNITFCSKGRNTCSNYTLTESIFTETIMTVDSYVLTTQGKQDIFLKVAELVKLPAPKNITATYLNNSGVQIGAYQYSHDFVKNFQFQVHIWNRTFNQPFESNYEPFIIEWESLGDLKNGSDYLVKMRVRPGDGYFKGSWSDWSPTINFTVDKGMVQKEPNEPMNDDALLFSIIAAIIAILVLVICLVTRFRRKELKAFILPNVPHPKTTLVHMQKFNKGLLLNFSPEIFSDIDINRMDEIGEGKPLSSESTDGLDTTGTRSRCLSQLSQLLLWQVPPGEGSDGSDTPGGSQSTLEDGQRELEDHGDELDASGTGWRPLRVMDPNTGDSGNGSGDPTLPSPTCAPQRECKDEAYVTMSSLFKTQ